MSTSLEFRSLQGNVSSEAVPSPTLRSCWQVTRSWRSLWVSTLASPSPRPSSTGSCSSTWEWSVSPLHTLSSPELSSQGEQFWQPRQVILYCHCQHKDPCLSPGIPAVTLWPRRRHFPGCEENDLQPGERSSAGD